MLRTYGYASPNMSVENDHQLLNLAVILGNRIEGSNIFHWLAPQRKALWR